MRLVARDRVWSWAGPAARVLVVGIVNVTPDSFADGGRWVDPEAAACRARVLAVEGADLIDLGAESTRPGSTGVSATEELDRLLPVLRRLLPDAPCPISIDTSKPEVAEAALDAGAHLINDVTGLAAGVALAQACARHGAGLVIGHMRGTPRTMQQAPAYGNLMVEVRDELGAAVARAEASGLSREAICVDPGIGFGKTAAHSLEILGRLDALAPLGRPVMVGPSRKSFIGAVLELPVEERVEGTIGACVTAALRGAHLLRVHDVQAVRRAVRVAEAIGRAAGPPGSV